MGYRPECVPIFYYYPNKKADEQVNLDISVKTPTKRWDTCGLTEDSVLVDSGARGEKVER